MAIDMAALQEEKVLLQKDFEEMKKNIQKVEVDLVQMRANMNAINGAIQQTDRLLNRSITFFEGDISLSIVVISLL